MMVTCLQLYQKRDIGTGVFLWILWNFKEHLFYRTPLCDCFYHWREANFIHVLSFCFWKDTIFNHIFVTLLVNFFQRSWICWPFTLFFALAKTCKKWRLVCQIKGRILSKEYESTRDRNLSDLEAATACVLRKKVFLKFS